MFVNKKKVCLIYKKISEYGGQERFVFNLSNYLHKTGWDVVILTSKVERYPETKNIFIVPHIPFPQWLKIISFSVNAYIYSGIMRKRGYITFGFGKTFCTDVFRAGGGVHLKYTQQALLRFRHPISRTYHKFKRLLSPYHYAALTIERMNFKCKKTRLFIAPSEMVKQDLMRYFGINEERIAVVYNEVNRNVFNSNNREEARKKLEEKLKTEGFFFLFVSTNHLLKGLDYLLDAFRIAIDQMPSAMLLVAGSGQETYFRRKIKRTGLSKRVILLGKVKNVSILYRGSDVLVYPSLFDASSNVVMEALSCGLPVMVSRYTGYCELVENSGAGTVIEDPTDISTLSSILIDYYNKPREEIKKLGEAGEKYVNSINTNQFKTIEGFLNELISR